MTVFRTIIESAVGSAIAEHPKYFTPKGAEKAQGAIVRKIMAALSRGDGEQVDEPIAPPQPNQPFIMANVAAREARGYANLRRLSGAVEPKRAGDLIVIPKDAYCEAVFALADLPPPEEWLFLTEAAKTTAWLEFFRRSLTDTARRSIVETRDGAHGILMPYPWPPSKTGKVYLPDEAGPEFDDLKSDEQGEAAG